VTDIKEPDQKQVIEKNDKNTLDLEKSVDSKSRPPKRRRQAPPPKATLWPIYTLITLILVAVALAGMYFWQTLSKQDLAYGQVMSMNQNLRSRIDKIEQGSSTLINKLEEKSNKNIALLAHLEKQSIFNTQKLSELGANSRTDWLLAEVEYLLHLANQRLVIEKDAKGAEAIMLEADKVLSEINDPGLLPIRIELARETLDLQKVTPIDTNNIYARLLAVSNSLDEISEGVYLSNTGVLPTKAEPYTSTEENGLLSLWKEIWSDLKLAFVIRRLDEKVEPLMAPEQSYYLKQNLRLMLEQASLALLEQNEPIYQSNLSKAGIWINRYFDTKDENITVILTNINEMSTLTIAHALPDISNSLRLLKKKIEAMYRSHAITKLSSFNAEAAEKELVEYEGQNR